MDFAKRVGLHPLLAAGFLVLAGCALQADLVDVQMDMENIQDEQRQIKQLLQGQDRPEGLLESAQKTQSDLVIRMDQLATDLQVLQGSLEEDRHNLSILMQKVDELAFRDTEVDERLGSIESRVSSLTESISAPDTLTRRPADAPPAVPDDKKMVLPGRPPLSSLTPIEVYNLAYNDYLKGNYDLAITGFRNFLDKYPDSTLTPHALYWLGESYYSKREYFKAIESFDRVSRSFPKSEKVPTAMLKQGFSYAEVGDKSRARSVLKRVVEEFPLSNEASLAKNRLAEIN